MPKFVTQIWAIGFIGLHILLGTVIRKENSSFNKTSHKSCTLFWVIGLKSLNLMFCIVQVKRQVKHLHSCYCQNSTYGWKQQKPQCLYSLFIPFTLIYLQVCPISSKLTGACDPDFTRHPVITWATFTFYKKKRLRISSFSFLFRFHFGPWAGSGKTRRTTPWIPMTLWSSTQTCTSTTTRHTNTWASVRRNSNGWWDQMNE